MPQVPGAVAYGGPGTNTAPLGTTVPTNTVVGSVFTDAWPAAWTNLGFTDNGFEFNTQVATASVDVEESLVPIAYTTTGRTTGAKFAAAQFTATILQWAQNGGIITVTGSTTTTLTQLDAPVLGSEIRRMYGWQSVTNDVRIILFQCLNKGQVQVLGRKGNVKTLLGFDLQAELPPTTVAPAEYRVWTAGAVRA